MVVCAVTVRDPLGPGMNEYWSCCWERQQLFYGTVWITSPLLCLVAVFISVRLHISLRAAPVTAFRQSYLHCSLLPLVTALGNLVVVMTSPRSEALADVLKSQYEGFVLFSFGGLLFQMLTLESSSREDDGNEDDSDVGERIVNAIGLQGPQKHFATAPLCCCLGRCMREHHLSGKQLLLCIFMLQQYMFVIPGSSVVSLWCALVIPQDYHWWHVRCIYFKKFSQLTALWGLFVLYRATKKMLKRWGTGQKFLALKIMVIIQILQRPIIGLIVNKALAHSLDDDCLGPDFMIDVTNCWLLLGWTVVNAVLIMRAFPAKEVMNEDDSLYMPGNFNIDLKRHVQSLSIQSRQSQQSSRPTGPESLVSSTSTGEGEQQSFGRNEEPLIPRGASAEISDAM